jgi:D-alanine--poly(phosphoribitol) ligase subunit 2
MGRPEVGDVIAVRGRIHRLFATALNLDVPSINTDLFETGVLDSLAFVELLLQIEQQFGVTTSVHDLEAENFKSIAHIADFVIERGGGALATSRGRVLSMKSAG